MTTLALAWFLALAPVPWGASAIDGPDADGDGLSDFHERHKYGTDPGRADSDGDGIADGDWHERREYAYTVRAVVHVMKPVTLAYLDDDYQDARLLDEGDDWVELEVVLYPFGTAQDAIPEDGGWRAETGPLSSWLVPGPTSDWTPEMAAALVAALAQDGIDVEELSDRELVRRVSKWLMGHADYHDGFSSFVTSFDADGEPYIDADLEDRVEGSAAQAGMGLDEQWSRELSARGMFEAGVRGSCTSSAIYISGCLRALGVPTRTVFCIPLVDANDERERSWLESRLEHNGVRRIVAASARGAVGSWSSHTFNEVWIAGRWRRLNYDRLGQDILDPHYLGLMIHVATFRDWADADMPATVGRHAGRGGGHPLFDGPNPYSTISLSDAFGVHCDVRNPDPEIRRLKVDALHWTDGETTPANIRESCAKRGRFGLLAEVQDLESRESMLAFLAAADPRIWLEAEGHPRLGVGFDAGCWWYDNGTAYVYVPFGGGDRRGLVEGVEYVASAGNAESPEFLWDLDLRIVRGR